MCSNPSLQIQTTYSSLGCDVSAAHHFSSSQGLFSLSSFPQSHESRHLCRENTHGIDFESNYDKSTETCIAASLFCFFN